MLVRTAEAIEYAEPGVVTRLSAERSSSTSLESRLARFVENGLEFAQA